MTFEQVGDITIDLKLPTTQGFISRLAGILVGFKEETAEHIKEMAIAQRNDAYRSRYFAEEGRFFKWTLVYNYTEQDYTQFLREFEQVDDWLDAINLARSKVKTSTWTKTKK